jgi:hypothetical protein
LIKSIGSRPSSKDAVSRENEATSGSLSNEQSCA